MGKQQDVIKKFMQALGETSASGEKALDYAVMACSNFKSWDDLTSHMLSDYNSYGSYRDDKLQFLYDKCRVNPYNSDVGAIIGFDAGSGVEKTAADIVKEEGDLKYPESSTSVISGLTVYWPQSYTLQDDEKYIVSALNSWWIKGGLDLIKESYGMGFDISNVSTKNLTVKFVYESYTDGAYVEADSYDSNGKATGLTLNINMNKLSTLSRTDPSGALPNNDLSFDRTIAGALSEALDMATIKNYSSLPYYFRNGKKLLTYGGDSHMGSSGLYFAASDVNGGYDSTEANYLALRYLATQASGEGGLSSDEVLPSGAYQDWYSYSKMIDPSEILITSSFKGEIWLDGWDIFNNKSVFKNSEVETINATHAKSEVLLAGNAKDNNLKAGSGGSNLWGGWQGNDDLYGGGGKDTFWYLKGGGNDVVHSAGKEDTIMFWGIGLRDFSGVGVSGNDIVTYFNDGGSLRITNGLTNSVKCNLTEDNASWSFDSSTQSWNYNGTVFQ